ncbi:MAG: UDP-3-O-acyl-N-acetylglucosamine deacetylase [Pirellulaceae bacterium]
MPSLRHQNTIQQPAIVTGFGYWSGQDVTVEFRPAAEDTGIRFVRCDLPGTPAVPARIANRTQSPRRTTICQGAASVGMVEHIMAALYALQIDNCEIWVNNGEMPGFDGSSQPFVEALDRAGVQSQGKARAVITTTDTLKIGDDEHCWIQIEPCDHFRITYHLDYPHQRQIGRQDFELDVTPESFREEVAQARTFLLRHEAEWLLQQGLGQRVSYQHVLVFGDDGPIDNSLRYSDECVRHKTLDVIGDFALAGYDLLGHITAYRTGHRLNGELVKRLLKHGQVLTDNHPQYLLSGKSA